VVEVLILQLLVNRAIGELICSYELLRSIGLYRIVVFSS